MRLQNDKGEIQISSEVFTTITGAVATRCFGVKGMAARSKKDGLVHLLRSESMAKGVRVIFQEDDTVSIELHIIVDQGVNLAAGGIRWDSQGDSPRESPQAFLALRLLRRSFSPLRPIGLGTRRRLALAICPLAESS